MKDTNWENTRIVKSDSVAEIRKLEEERGPDIVMMGSGTIVSLLARAKLIDRLMLVVKPVAIGIGRPMFEGMDARVQERQRVPRLPPGQLTEIVALADVDAVVT
jgi:dihydrofolate reductase